MTSASQAKHILYCGEAPREVAGSPRTVKRHLVRMLDDGWQLTIVLPWGTGKLPELWPEGVTTLRLPHRLWWWPPYRDNAFLEQIRTRLLAQWVRQRLHAPVDAVFGYLSAFEPLTTATAIMIARQLGVPSALLLHDDPSAFGGEGSRGLTRYRELAAACSAPLPVTQALADRSKIGDHPGAEVLLPIPDDNPPAPPTAYPQGPLHLLFAGTLHPGHIPVLTEAAERLQRRGGQLTCISRPSAQTETLGQHPAVTCRDLFPRSLDVLHFAAEQTHGLLHCYGLDADIMPMARSSFPSKWIDFASAGIPTYLQIPPESAVAVWATDHEWPNLGLMPDWTAFEAFLDRLDTAAGWQAEVAQSNTFAATHFAPEVIHHQLVCVFERILSTSPA